VNIYHRFGSLRSPVTHHHHRFAASLPLATREFSPPLHSVISVQRLDAARRSLISITVPARFARLSQVFTTVSRLTSARRFNYSSPYNGSLPLVAREYSSPFRLAPLAGHKSSSPFRGSPPLAVRKCSSPLQIPITVTTARCGLPVVNIYHCFGSLRSPVTNLHHRFAARFRSVFFHHRFNYSSPFSGSLPLAVREYSSPSRLAPLAGHRFSLPFRGSLKLASRISSLPIRVDPRS